MSVLISSFQNSIFACAVCTGPLDDAATKAANMGIWVMLFILFGVFAGVLSFIVSLARKSRQVMAEAEINEK
ncbi:MAG: hypothetical protein GXP30_12945 [Verrucomicrobia bacterium]|nr:hypothetical protein [Verrucomicrobiota bacterium]